MLSPKLIVISLVIFCCVFNLSSAKTAHGYAHLLAPKISYRLPNNTVPKFYSIKLEPHIDNPDFTFDGEGIIQFEVVKETTDVTFHASHWILIDKNYTELSAENGTIFKPILQSWNPVFEFFGTRFNFTLGVGNYSLKLKWLGRNAQRMDGFFRSSNIEKDEHISFVVATHFQATAARGAFPCWDEPKFRTPFEIGIKHHSNYTALSNMPVKNQTAAENGTAKIWTNFETSPPMSTYLITFILSDYENCTSKDTNLTFWAPKGRKENVLFAFNVSKLVFPALEKYTGVKFNLPKLDQVSIPTYPASGTEHWGMISYGQRNIMYKKEQNDRSAQDRVALLVAHELTHQWFGDLVTPDWWSDLWLSEAFAVYFSYKILDQALDNQHYVETFVVEVLNTISFIAEKFGRSPRPITFMPESTSEIRDLFTLVTYRKGASIVYMLEHIVSEDVFQRGLSKYLQRHQLKTVQTNDLWQALQETYDEMKNNKSLNIKEIMEPWVKQLGHPMVNITRNYKTGFINVTQNDMTNSESNNTWTIPLNFATSSHPSFNSTEPTHWLNKSNEIFPLNGIGREDDWIVANIQQTGFYRVNYDFENWKRLAEYLNTDNYKNIHVINRAQLIWDLQYLFAYDNSYFEILIDVLSYLHRETNYLPWIPGIDMIEKFSKLLINTPAYDEFQKFSLHLMNKIIDDIGYESNPDDDRLTALAKEHLLPWACDFDHVGCKNAARKKLTTLLQNSTTNSRDSYWIYCNGLKTMNQSVWENLIGANNENLIYLGCSNDHVLIKKHLDLIITENLPQVTAELLTDTISSITSGIKNNVDFILDYFIENIEKIRQFYNSRDENPKLGRTFRIFSTIIKNNDQYEKFSKFLAQQEADRKMTDTNDVISVTRNIMTSSEKLVSMFRTIMMEKPHLTNFINT